MSSHLSVSDVLTHLRKRLDFLREREAFHAQQEAFHREERSRYAAELEDVARRFEAFKVSSAEAVDAAAKNLDTAGPDDDGPDLGGRPKLPRLVSRVLEGLPKGYSFGARWLTQEINQRFGKRLRKPTNARLVSIVLRRMAQKGELLQNRPGRPHQEARYTLPKPEAV